jgi:hypothetical protein
MSEVPWAPSEARPEVAVSVDEPQVPAVASWSWDTNKVVMVVAGMVGIGFAIYFAMQYQATRKAHIAIASEVGVTGV